MAVLDRVLYEVTSDDLSDTDAAVLRKEVITFGSAVLNASHPRTDHKESTELCLISLGSYQMLAGRRHHFKHTGPSTICSINFNNMGANKQNCLLRSLK